MLRPFVRLNRGKPYSEQVKPFNFLLTTFVAPLGHPAGVDPAKFHLVAPYEPEPRRWLRMPWTDLHSTRAYQVTTEASHYATDRACIKTYHDVLEEYRTHPESKSAASGGKACTRATVGLLGRLHVTPASLGHLGKETNLLEEVQAGLVHDPEEVYIEFADPRRDPHWQMVLQRLKQIPVRNIMAETGLSRSQIVAIRNGHAHPRPKHRSRLLKYVENCDGHGTMGRYSQGDDVGAQDAAGYGQ